MSGVRCSIYIRCCSGGKVQSEPFLLSVNEVYEGKQQ